MAGTKVVLETFRGEQDEFSGWLFQLDAYLGLHGLDIRSHRNLQRHKALRQQGSRPCKRAGLKENGAPRGRAVRKAYLEPQYNPLKSSAGAFFGGGAAAGGGGAAAAAAAASCSRRITS